MTKVTDKNSFVTKARSLHGEQFSYDEFNYVNAKTRSTIICLKHNEKFEQSSDKHFNSIYPCPLCLKEHRFISAKERVEKIRSKGGGIITNEKSRLSKEDYQKRLLEKYSDTFTYNLDKYVSVTKGEVVLSCKEHGDSIYTPSSLLASTYGCAKCGKNSAKKTMTKNYLNFLEESNTIHNGKYLYLRENEESYINRKSIVKIKCSKHGVFEKKAQKHLSGQGCFKCRVEELVDENILVGGYCETIFSRNSELKECDGFLYYLAIDGGKYYKIGITRHDVKRRVSSIKSSSKLNIEIVDYISGSLYDMYKLEQLILDKNCDKRIKMDWSTEIFDTDILVDSSLSEYCQRIQLPREDTRQSWDGYESHLRRD